MLLEIIAETLEDAREAEQGGAGRIELVRHLDRGGLTPPLALIEAVVRTVRIPVRVMLRESEPFESPDCAELGRLRAAARDAHARGAEGFVAGFLRNGAVDLEGLQEVMGARANPVTFHRAFDEAADPLASLTALAAEARVDRVLTSGGAGEWPARFARLRALRLAAPAGLTILPGGGIDDDALRALAGAGFSEMHVGRAARVPADHSGRVRASRVAELVALATSAGAP